MSVHRSRRIVLGVLLGLSFATFLVLKGRQSTKRDDQVLIRGTSWQQDMGTVEDTSPSPTKDLVPTPAAKQGDASARPPTALVPAPMPTASPKPQQEESLTRDRDEGEVRPTGAPVMGASENTPRDLDTLGSLPRSPHFSKRGDGSEYSPPSLESRQSPCDDSSTCSFKNGCVSDEEGICYKPDFAILHPELISVQRNEDGVTSPQGGRHDVELKCSWMPNEPSTLPELSPWFQSLVDFPPPTGKRGTQRKTPQPPLNITEQILAFKHFSGTAFGNRSWFDWGAPVKEVDPKEGFTTRGRHIGPDKVYVLENLCFDSGALAGFNADLEKWRGRDEMGHLHREHPLRQGSDQLKFPVLRKLRTQPTWYIDRKLAILPVGTHWWHHHNAVAQTRAAGLIANIESAWPSADPEQAALKPRDDVTVAFSANFGHKRVDGLAIKMFQTMAAMSHIAVHARMKPVTKPNYGWPQYGYNTVCFKEAVYFQGCYHDECAKVNPPKRQISLWGTNNPVAQRFVARRFRACVNAADDTMIQDRSRHIAPTVLVPQRSLGRAYLQPLHLLVQVHKSLITIFPPPAKPRIVAMEMSDLSVVQTISLYTHLDVIISTWNSGLMYGFLTGRLLRPTRKRDDGSDDGGNQVARAVGLAIQLDSNRESHPESGLNKNPSFDFGSQYVGMNSSVDVPLPTPRNVNSSVGSRTVTRNGWDLQVNLPKHAYWRYVKRDWLETTYMPRPFFDRVVRTGLCLWKVKHEGNEPMGESCENTTEPDALIGKFQRDKHDHRSSLGGGLAQDLRYQIRALVSEATSAGFPRLVSLYNSLLSGQLDELWERYSHSPGNPKRIAQGFADGPQLLLVMKSCPASWSDDSALPLSTELRVLLRALPSTVSLMFLFGSPCLWPETKEAIFSAWPTVGSRGKLVVPIPLDNNNFAAQKLYCGHTKRIEGHCLEMLRVRNRSHYKETKKLLLMVADEGVTLPEPLTKAITGTPVLWLGAKGKWRVGDDGSDDGGNQVEHEGNEPMAGFQGEVES